MPRGRKAGSVTETLEQQIGKAQLKVHGSWCFAEAFRQERCSA